MEPTKQRHIKVNLMKLRDKNHTVDSNIFNVTIGEIMKKEVYKRHLQEEVKRLRNKVSRLESESEKKNESHSLKIQRKEEHNHKSSFDETNTRIDSAKRLSLCGRIVRKSEISKQFGYFSGRANQKPDSNYFVWNPKIDSH